jgi:hypothetical protein
VSEIEESPPSTQKTSTMDPLGGDVGEPGEPTINAKNVDDGTPRRRCRRSETAHHQKSSTVVPREAVLETSERTPSMQKRSTVGPLRGTAGDPGAPNINTKNIDGGPLGGGARDSGVPTTNT